MKIIFFGGAFDPPHIGHEAICLWLCQNAGADKILISPSKSLSKFISTDIQTRQELVRKLIESVASKTDTSNVECAFDELLSPSFSGYTVDTISKLKAAFPDSLLSLAVGSDQYKVFDSWKCYSDILRMATLYVFGRSDDKLEPHFDDLTTIFVPMNVKISSREVREKIKTNSPAAVKEWLPKPVLKVVLEKKLYL